MNIDDLEGNFNCTWDSLTEAEGIILTKVDEDDLEVVTGALTDSEISDLAIHLSRASDCLSLVAKKLYQLNLIPDEDGVLRRERPGQSELSPEKIAEFEHLFALAQHANRCVDTVASLPDESIPDHLKQYVVRIMPLDSEEEQ